MKDSHARLAGVPQRFLELLPQWLAIDISLSLSRLYGNLPSSALQIQIQEVFEFYVKSIHSFSLGRCQGCLSKRLDEGSCSDGLLLLYLCNCGDRMERLDRHLTSEGCNTLSMAKT